MTTIAALKALAAAVAGTAALLYGYLFVNQGEMVFPGSKMELKSIAWSYIKEAYPDVEPMWLETVDGERLQGWFINSPEGDLSANNNKNKPLLIYFGGNAEEVSHNIPDFSKRFRGYDVALFNYRGFGGSTGAPSEHALVADALLQYDDLSKRLSPSGVVLMGRSLGCGVAVALASKRPVHSIVLVSAYRSLVHLGERYYPWVPVSLLLKHRFDSLVLAPGRLEPALFVAGTSDNIIPMDESRLLMEAWGGSADYIEVQGAGHNDIQGFGSYWDAVTVFLDLVLQRIAA